MQGVLRGIILQLLLPCWKWENSLISWCSNSRLSPSDSHREVLSCFNTRQLPCFAFKTLYPYLQLGLGAWKLCIFVLFVCHTIWAGVVGWADRTSFHCCPLHFQRLKCMTLQSDARLALLKIDFIQKSLMISFWLSISCSLVDKGWCAHHTFKFTLLKGELLHLLANKTLRLLFSCLSAT